jgi:hypothetical protein
LEQGPLMFRWRHLLPWMLLALVVGCAREQTVRPGGFDALRGGQAPPEADSVLMDVAVIERPVGDRYLNGELWDWTDQHPGSPEQNAALEDNGLRVGRLVGSTPGQLQALLTSKRHCVIRWRQFLPVGRSVALTVGRKVPEARYQVGQDPEVALEQAQSYLLAMPELTTGGRTRLQFTPQFKYGGTVAEYQAAPDMSGWMLTYGPRSKTYPALGWEVSLAPNEYVLLGATLDNPQSLGYQLFVQDDGQTVTQRVVAIRTGRRADFDDLPGEPTERFAAGTPTAPLALQATWTTARGSRP